MAIVLGADGYATAAAYDAYHDARLDFDGTSVPDERKEAALRDATLYIDAYLRGGGLLPSATGDHLVYADPDLIPPRVAEATLRLAREIVRGADPFAGAPAKGLVKREKVDALEKEYFEASSGLTAAPARRFPFLHALLAPLLPRGSGGAWVPLMRG